jgi:glucokinase
MSPPGRPKGEYRRAQPEGTPVSPPGRPKGEYRRAQPEGTPVSASAGPRLLGDVGGTNARFAWQDALGAPLTHVAAYACAQFASLEAVVRHYLTEQALATPTVAAIGIANPVVGDQVQMTNHAWHFSIEALRRALGLQRLLMLNDFAALALALPALPPHELRAVGGGAAVPRAPLALLGPGTGLGVSGLLFDARGREHVLSGEGGHVTLAAADDDEAAVIDWLRRKFGHASAERALSGSGLENLYRARAAVLGHSVEPLPAMQITARALAGADAACDATLELFLGLLGNVAGNLALTLGATGGLYIGGGIVPRLGPRVEHSRFRARFEAKGRFAGYLSRIPVWVVRPEGSPALRGAARALDAP